MAQGPYRNVQGDRIPGDVERMLGGWFSSTAHSPPSAPALPLSAGVPLIGQAVNVEISRSFDAMLGSVRAVMREAEEITNRIALRSEQIARYLGDAAEGARAAAEASTGGAGGQEGGEAPPTLGGPPDDLGPPLGPPSPTPPTVDPGTIPPIVDPENEAPVRGLDRYSVYGYENGRFSASALRRLLVTQASQRISQLQPRIRLEQDAQGTWRHWDDRIATLPPDEQELALAAMPAASDGEVADHLRSAATLGILKNTFGGMVEGRSVGQAVLGALPTGAAKVAGIAGAVLTGANYLSDFAENQRATNAAYQRVLGGTNLTGFAERGRANLFALGQFGVMGEDEAERLYQQTLGIYGTDREGAGRANQFATAAYREFGMTVNQSVELVRLAAGQGSEAFSSLTQALRNVTSAARDAGMSAEQVRQAFTANYRAAVDVAGGAGGIALAQQMTVAQTQLGRRFEDVSLTGQLSDQQLYMQASRAGMPIADYLALQRTPEGQVMRAQVADQGVARVVQAQLPQAAISEIGRRVAEADPEGRGANIATNDPFWAELAADVQQEYNVNPLVMRDLLANLGGVSGLDAANSVEYAVKALTGKTSQASAVQEEQERVASREVDRRQLRSVGGPRGVVGEQAPELADLVESVGLPEGTTDFDRQLNLFGVGSINAENMRRQYVRGVQQSGVRNPVVEQLLGEVGEGTRLQVRTKGGERVVSVEEAIANFQDQIQSGEAMIVQGSGSGQSVGEFLGAADQTTKVTSADDEKLAEVGQSVEEFRKEEGKGGSGRVLIAPTPELQRWLNFTTSGSAVIDPARRAGVPPTASPAPELMTGG